MGLNDFANGSQLQIPRQPRATDEKIKPSAAKSSNFEGRIDALTTQPLKGKDATALIGKWMH